ncbi:hypothetical protein Mhypo_02564 [Meiothermus hypogaeus]|uniref:Uncharacterized protein n=1 Tax=Meiothermus hypogaeus TaxID=884155 RepID=A0ABX9MNJ6_9DEIN|nr:hypothetical protein Mhypo_02564 [Meiothermus hypogaeus]
MHLFGRFAPKERHHQDQGQHGPHRKTQHRQPNHPDRRGLQRGQVEHLLANKAQHRRQPRQRERSQHHRYPRNGHHPKEARKLVDITGAGLVVHRPRRHEKPPLVERVGQQEGGEAHGCVMVGKGYHPDGKDQRPQRGYGGVGQQALEIGVAEGKGGPGEQGGQSKGHEGCAPDLAAA